MEKKIVIALGGNALGNSPSEQLELVKEAAKNIVDLIELGNDVVVSHGNGPQVGMIYNGMNENNMPFAECGAMSQGYIGYHLQQLIGRELNKRNIQKNVATIVTQVVVDKNDKGFQDPTKPIGLFYTKEEAEQLEKELGVTFKEDAGRGYRRVIASPLPKEIVEINIINDLINNGNVVITCGGGGVPVISEDNGFTGVPAVIDKDKTSALLAEKINADLLVILTAVEKVYIHYGKENQIGLDKLSLTESIQYIENNEFAKGSMLPKVEACLEFVSKTGKHALITSLEKAKDALSGKTGTIVYKEK